MVGTGKGEGGCSGEGGRLVVLGKNVNSRSAREGGGHWEGGRWLKWGRMLIQVNEGKEASIGNGEDCCNSRSGRERGGWWEGGNGEDEYCSW